MKNNRILYVSVFLFILEEKYMLVTLIPLFDESMSVRAYSISSQKGNSFHRR